MTISDRGYVDKQVIRPGLVNRALEVNKLVEVNPLWQNIQTDLSWKNVSQESDPELWNISLTKIIRVLKVKLMRVTRILKEMIILMKKK